MKKLYFVLILVFGQLVGLSDGLSAQIAIEPATRRVEPKQVMPEVSLSVGRYLDQNDGTTADEAVRIALENNGEIKALRDEIEAAKALIKQARLRPNPSLRIGGSHEFFVGNRYSAGVSANLPLELGGRRKARINVAENQFKVRDAVLADREGELAAKVRLTFGESLAQIEKLRFLDELLANVEQGYKLISAKVVEGSNPPLEQNMSVVELNRVRSMREIATGNVEVKLLELRNSMGVEAATRLLLKGDFENLLGGLPTRKLALAQAVLRRPDLAALRLNFALAKADLEKAQAGGRLDAGVSLGFQRLTRITLGITNQNPVELSPQRIGENFLTFGVDLKIPVRNKNQGAIESAGHKIQAAQKRIDFGELTVRRQVTSAYIRYERAARALMIYQNGVRNQARENLKVVWQTYELGKANLRDYIAEERRYLELENSLIDAQLEVYAARIEIHKVIDSPELR